MPGKRSTHIDRCFCRCECLDHAFALCGQDPDDALAFTAPKTVLIKDRACGLSYYLIVGLTMLYIAFDFVFSPTPAYLRIQAPVGTSDITVELPPIVKLPPPPHNCPDCPQMWGQPLLEMDLPYCSTQPPSDGCNAAAGELCDKRPSTDPKHNYTEGVKMPCLYWDTQEMTVPIIGRQLLLTTRIDEERLTYFCKRKFCTDAGCVYAPDVECIRRRFHQSELASKLSYSRPNPTYPLVNRTFSGFVAGAEYADVRIDHTMYSPATGTVKAAVGERSPGLHLSSRDMHGQLIGCDGTVVKEFPKWDMTAGVPFIEDRVRNRYLPLRLLLDSASLHVGDQRKCGINLDTASGLIKGAGCELSGKVLDKECGNTLRYDGIALLISIHYNNINPNSFERFLNIFWFDADAHVDYRIQVHGLTHSDMQFSQQEFPHKPISDHVHSDDPERVSTFRTRHGVLLMVQQTGTIGVFDLQQMMTNVVVAMGLVASASVITQALAKYVVPMVTGDKRYYELLVEESPDFNEDTGDGRLVRARKSSMLGEFAKGDIGWARVYDIQERDTEKSRAQITWIQKEGVEDLANQCRRDRLACLNDHVPSGEYTLTAWPNPEWYEEVSPDEAVRGLHDQGPARQHEDAAVHSLYSAGSSPRMPAQQCMGDSVRVAQHAGAGRTASELRLLRHITTTSRTENGIAVAQDGQAAGVPQHAGAGPTVGETTPLTKNGGTEAQAGQAADVPQHAGASPTLGETTPLAENGSMEVQAGQAAEGYGSTTQSAAALDTSPRYQFY